MCGIFALLGAEVKAAAIRAISARQRHRGPDSSGVFCEGKVALAHERLSIVDVNGGHQPFITNGVVLVANGEIYDFFKHRQDLEAKGHVFTSNSDCEVLLHLYIEHGPEFMERVKVHGMFAFAIYDGRNDSLVIGRDHIGIIPLYWSRDGPVVAAASELKCLTNDLPWTPAPAGIVHFPPGCVYSSATGEVRSFYTPAWSKELPSAPYDAVALREDLFTAVRSHMLCDVPYGCLLSGGLDSSLIAAVAARVLADDSAGGARASDKQWKPKKLITFTIGMEDSADVKFARECAKFIDSEHHEFIFNAEEALSAIRDVVYHLETYDSEPVRPGIMQYWLAKQIRKLGLKVVLSGEGADEIFGGYWNCKNLTTKEEIHKETCGEVFDLHHTDVQRANKAMMAHSVELRVPFLDRSFLDASMSFDPEFKMPKKRHSESDPVVEKWALRKTAALEPTLLPESVLWREKDGFSSGVGNSYKRAIDKLYDELVSDEDLAQAHKRWPRLSPTTKEEYYFRKTFEELFGPDAAGSVPSMWKDDRMGMVNGEDWMIDANSRRRIGADADCGEGGA